MRAAAAQCPSVPFDVEANLETAARLAREAARADAELLVFPELFLSGAAYLPRMWDAAPTPGDASERRLSRLARDHRLHLVVGTAERRDQHLYNTALLISPDGQIDRYTKLHLFTADAFLFRRGVGPVVWRTAVGRIGVGICYDMLFGSPWNRYAGAVDLVAISSAWPEFAGSVTTVCGCELRAPQMAATRAAQRWVQELPRRIGRSVGAPVTYANLSGTSDIALFHERAFARLTWAASSSVDDGARMCRCGHDGEGLAVAEVGAWRADAERAPYHGVAADTLVGGARAVLAAFGAAEWTGAHAGYAVMQAWAGVRRAMRRPAASAVDELPAAV